MGGGRGGGGRWSGEGGEVQVEVPGTGDGREGRLGMGGERVGRCGVRRRSKDTEGSTGGE